ncbi:ParA family protein [Mesorhizobium sp. J428]|uniref:ParA family protein n=1 Tax=Mesorhizobium sp. J428 TaxID=2898440 RepID=UPI0021508E74|nr:ParA family protein [Mesorhizobium sp. J428]MCR5860128.1 ParA family protein [Mesorhizobium sp. J428]MCR5860221.1 ParA family protein [Mesorhizobium sp. J428]
MKTIVLANQKGGVGKSAVACQLAYFFSQPINQPMNKRVLVIDLDHQRNTTKALRTGGFCVVSATTSSKLLTDPKADIEHAEFVLVPGDGDLLKMEKKAAEHNAYASNLLAFLARVADSFDVCIIDTNPNPDIRQLSPLVVADYVLAPIELNQEAIDGIGDLLNHENIGIRRIQATLNKKLKFLGILPNKVEPTPFQRDNFRALSTAYPKYLIAMSPGFAAIKKSTAIAEAQAAGVPVWRLGKTSGRDAWREMRPVFDKIAQLMEVA